MTPAQCDNMVRACGGGGGGSGCAPCRRARAGRTTYAPLHPLPRPLQTNKWKVFMTRDGRLSLAGLNKARCAYLAQAMDDSVRNH